MSKCSNCGKNAKVLVSYGDMLLCDGCVSSYDNQVEKDKDISGKWLIRTADGKILGPYKYEPLRKLISDKKVVFLDEVSRSGDDWTLIKNIEVFRDIALQASYSLNESTVDVDLNNISAQPVEEPVTDTRTTKRSGSRPPLFKRQATVDVIVKSSLMWWKKKKNALFGMVTTLLLVAAVISFYFINTQKKDSDMLNMVSGNDNFNRYYIEGREFEEGGLFKEAAKYYDKSLSLNSSHSGTRIRKAAIDLVIDGDTSSAEKELEKLYSDTNIGKITDQEEQADIKTFLGILEAKKNNNQSAIGYFNQALAIKPTNAYLYYNIGAVLFKQGNYTEALEYFKNAQKLLPMFTDAILYEGRSLMKLNRFKEAAKTFSEGTAQNPNIRQFYTLGAYSVFKTTGQGADKILEVLKNITAIDPYYAQKIFIPLCQIDKDSTIADEINYTMDMIKDFNDSQKVQASYLLAMLYLMDANYDAATKILSHLNIEKSSIAQFILGAIAYHQSKYDDAERKLAKSLELDYSNSIAHIYAGQISLKKDDMGQAKNHFTKAQATNESTSLYAITLLGDINIAVGEASQAMVLWKKVLSMDSHYTPAWQRILETNKKLNKKQ